MSTASASPRGAAVPDQVPILPLRDTVLFPQSALPLGAGRESSVRLLEDVVRGNRLIGVFTQRDASTEKPQQAEVVAVGPGARDEAGKLVELSVQAGDRVLFGKWSGTEVKIDGEDLLIMKESDILGVVEPRAELKQAA